MHISKQLIMLPIATAALGLMFLGSPGATARAEGNDATARLWAAKCGSCHGKDGKGQTKKGKSLKIADMTTAAWQKEVTNEAIQKAVKSGIDKTTDGVKQQMKPVSGLTPEQVKDLIKYVRAFKK